MNIKLILLFCTLLALGFINYQWRTGTGDLNGQVFVVTNGADNIKLGLVEVSVIPEQTMLDYIEAKKLLIDLEKNSISSELDTRYFEYLNISNSLIQNMRENFLKFDDKGNLDMKGFVIKYEETRINLDKKTSHIKDLTTAYRKIINPSPDYFYSDLPKSPIDKALTDADAKFSLKVPRNGKYVIAAHASRHLVGSIEEYYWLIWVSLNGETSKSIILSNNNLMTSDSPDSVTSVFNIAAE